MAMSSPCNITISYHLSSFSCKLGRYRCTYVKGTMVAVEIWKEDRNGYFSRSSIIVGEKCGVAVPYTIRIKLAQGKWKTSSYKLGKSEKHFNLPPKHRVLFSRMLLDICLSGYVTYLSLFKWEHRELVSIKSKVKCFCKLIKTHKPFSVSASHPL